MALPQNEALNVVKWHPASQEQSQHQDIELWMVKSKEERKHYLMWFKEGSTKLDELRAAYPRHALEITHRGAGFVSGKALEQVEFDISTALAKRGPRRPETVYRVTHEGMGRDGIFAQPHNGLKSRGFDINLRADPLYFQILVQKHLNFRARLQSPFLSVTSNHRDAIKLATVLDAHWYKGIKIHIINTNALDLATPAPVPGPLDPPAPRTKEEGLPDDGRGPIPGRSFTMWHVATLVDLFGLQMRTEHADEYLVENEIPEEAIICTRTWDQVRTRKDEVRRNLLEHRLHDARTRRETRRREREDNDNDGEPLPRRPRNMRPRSTGFMCRAKERV